MMEHLNMQSMDKVAANVAKIEVHYGQVKDYKSLMDIVLDR